MKTTKILAILIALFIGANFAHSQKTKTTVFDVNMHCGSCKAKVEKSIAFEKGVKDIQVSLENKTVCVTYKTKKSSDEKLIKAFKELGYDASVKKDCQSKCEKKCSQECIKKCGSEKSKEKPKCHNKN